MLSSHIHSLLLTNFFAVVAPITINIQNVFFFLPYINDDDLILLKHK